MCLGLKTSTTYLRQQEQIIRTKFAHVQQKYAQLKYEENVATYALLDHVLHLRHVQISLLLSWGNLLCVLLIIIYDDVSHSVCSI